MIRRPKQGWVSSSRSHLFDQAEVPSTYELLSKSQVRRKPLPKSFPHTVEADDDTILLVNPSLSTESRYQTAQPLVTSRKRPNLFSLWWLEIAAVLLSLFTLSAIFGLVFPYRVLRPIPSWPSEITINAVISILSFVLRASIVTVVAEALSQQKWIWFTQNRTLVDLLTFDRASRGPWGSALLIFRLSRISFMGVFGALIIIFTIGIGPFAQQLVRYETCSLPSSVGNATTHRQGYFTYESVPMTEKSQRAGSWAPGFSFRSFLTAGLFGSQATSVPVTCPSRNCTFSQPFSTLAVCSVCKDLSEDVTFSIRFDDSSQGLSGTANAVLPDVLGGKNLSIQNKFGYSGGQTMAMSIIAADSALFIIYTNPNYPKDLYSNPFSEQEQSDPALQWAVRGYGAAKCRFKACVHTYTVNIVDGVVAETLIDTSSVWEEFDYSVRRYATMLDVTCIDSAQRQAIKLQGYNVTESTKWLAYNDSLATDGYWYTQGFSNAPSPNKTQDPNFPPECVYQVHTGSVDAITLFLSNFLKGNVSDDEGNNGGSVTALSLYNHARLGFPRVEEVFTNVSRLATNYLRQWGNQTGLNSTFPKNASDKFFAPNQLALGVIMEAQTCVLVRWGWLAFPGGIILLTTVFLALTMFDSTLSQEIKKSSNIVHGKDISTRFRPAGTWKSSLLPLVFHGLDEEELRTSRKSGLASDQEMWDAAENIEARFMQGGSGWKLTKVD